MINAKCLLLIKIIIETIFNYIQTRKREFNHDKRRNFINNRKRKC